ncbi:uncharacterized protein F4822DRAFT_130790 [Hypoxylon trugodes]|uniref:uncharacterized protein n=1 Tax=Hypoxylon trugodes TaxID=326681 RepID=UPI0021923D14|nr:uncharacterized protein F4822DRAFT_130790 [Hypoxylon trugodes]KAI1392492.1 hypothetical protein F4822DRAFT_130790 [Hypoxylon trugodes]
MPLRHIAIPSSPGRIPPRCPTYALANRIQSKLQQELLAWKASPVAPPPVPALISFTPAPTYTLGRRQTEPLSTEELARLRAPLRVLQSRSGDADDKVNGNDKAFAFTPEVLHAPRGGLATYHGPGQVVLWPVIDLRSPLHTHFGVREYTCLLEKTTIATLRRLYGIEGFTTSNPGVWVRHSGTEERKVSALGVHLRRHVTGLGVAINFGMPVAGPEDVNPWARIIACGLGDKGVTSVAAQLKSPSTPRGEDIATAWVAEFATRLEIHDNTDGGLAVEQHNWDRLETELQIGRESQDYIEARELLT